MHETDDDLRNLQRLIDESHEGSGSHMRSIFTKERRLTAAQLSELLRGVQVLNLATVTASCQPRVAPVDGLFYRGQFYFGSSHESVRFRHIRARPQVSATHTRGERMAVIVHGTARMLDMASPENRGFRDYCLKVYGSDWHNWGAGAAYAVIEAEKMFTYSFGGEPDAEKQPSA